MSNTLPPTGPICQRGRQVPNLYVLGTEKAASSELGVVLIQSGVDTPLHKNKPHGKVVFSHTGIPNKEFHFFDGWGSVRADMKYSLQSLKARWHRFMPKCSNSAMKPLADMTPINLALTPVQLGSMKLDARPYEQILTHHTMELPSRLRQLYGAQYTTVRFLITLREPVARMQSAWWMQHDGSRTWRWPNRNQSFRAEIREAML
eukprot:5699246-Amphidinium_carterae.1